VPHRGVRQVILAGFQPSITPQGHPWAHVHVGMAGKVTEPLNHFLISRDSVTFSFALFGVSVHATCFRTSPNPTQTPLLLESPKTA
jgi:hypothetical protein